MSPLGVHVVLPRVAADPQCQIGWPLNGFSFGLGDHQWNCFASPERLGLQAADLFSNRLEIE